MNTELVPSTTLRRAALGDRLRLERAQERLRGQQETLREELKRVDHELSALGERIGTIDALLGTSSEIGAAEGGGGPTSVGRPAPLRGAEIRKHAARRFFLAHGSGRGLHYRRWFELLVADGSEIAGRDPLASLLTNLNRSPVVVRGDQPGTYAIDAQAPDRLRAELGERQAELRDLSRVMASEISPPRQLREHQARLAAGIGRLEGLLAEAEDVLRPEERDRVLETHTRAA
ncbi:MAG TPA: hypothetical protein VIJ51_18035 [Solirubrobacteraceae bacterium]